jgi:DNA-binding transcriptional LysR family regulator
VTNREALRRQLENNEPDLVIMGQPPEGVEVDATAFMDNPLVMIAPANHPLIEQTNIPLSFFSNENFVVRELGSGTRGATQRFFDEHGVPFNTAIEMTSK